MCQWSGDTGPGYWELTTIPQGSGDGMRVGKAIKVIRIEVAMHALVANDWVGDGNANHWAGGVLRTLLFVDNNTNGTGFSMVTGTPNTENNLMGGQYDSLTYWRHEERLQLLHDESIDVNVVYAQASTGSTPWYSSVTPVKIDVCTDTVITYSGTTGSLAEHTSKGIFLTAIQPFLSPQTGQAEKLPQTTTSVKVYYINC